MFPFSLDVENKLNRKITPKYYFNKYVDKICYKMFTRFQNFHEIYVHTDKVITILIF